MARFEPIGLDEGEWWVEHIVCEFEGRIILVVARGMEIERVHSNSLGVLLAQVVGKHGAAEYWKAHGV
jgi:hypothetical protein